MNHYPDQGSAGAGDVDLMRLAAGWFAGPTRLARSGRETIAPFLRENPWGTFAITLGILALLFIWDPIPATGTPAGIITFTLLALLGTELLIRQTAREFRNILDVCCSHYPLVVNAGIHKKLVEFHILLGLCSDQVVELHSCDGQH